MAKSISQLLLCMKWPRVMHNLLQDASSKQHTVPSKLFSSSPSTSSGVATFFLRLKPPSVICGSLCHAHRMDGVHKLDFSRREKLKVNGSEQTWKPPEKDFSHWQHLLHNTCHDSWQKHKQCQHTDTFSFWPEDCFGTEAKYDESMLVA